MEHLLTLAICLVICVALVASYDDVMMEDFRSKKQEIFRLREEGNIDEAKRLQNELYDKMQRSRMRSFDDFSVNSADGISEELERSMHASIRAHHEERRRQHKQEYTRRKSSSRTPSSKARAGSEKDGVSDVRAIHHMDQSRRKADILYNKIEKLQGTLAPEKIAEFEQLTSEYIDLERVVARYLQQTSDEYGKARTLNTKEARLAQVEKARLAKNSRIDLEKAAREAARDKFNSIRDSLEALLQQKQEL